MDNRDYPRQENTVNNFKKILALAFIAISQTACLGCTRVGPGYVGIVVNMAGNDKGVQEYPAKTGWVYYNIFSEEVKEYPTFVQSVVWTQNKEEGRPANEEITFTNKDQMKISVDVALSYHIEPAKVPSFYVKFRSDDLNTFTYGYLHSLTRDKFNDVGGSYDITQIMGNNGPFLKEVKEALQKDLRPIGVELEAQFGIIGAPRPPPEVVKAIDQKVQANQLAQQKQNELAQSTADANKEVAKAEGYARAVLARADAEAVANKKIADSITPNLIQLRMLEKWNGVMPTVQSGGSGGLILQLPNKQSDLRPIDPLNPEAVNSQAELKKLLK